MAKIHFVLADTIRMRSSRKQEFVITLCVKIIIKSVVVSWSHLRNREVSGILNVARLVIQLREGRVHPLVLTAGLAVLLWSWLLRRWAPLGLTVHWRRKHLSGSMA